jgi:hypothetical protein
MTFQPHAVGRVFNIDPDVRTLGMQVPVEIEGDGGGLFSFSARPPP